jgi:hypothetical protein
MIELLLLKVDREVDCDVCGDHVEVSVLFLGLGKNECWRLAVVNGGLIQFGVAAAVLEGLPFLAG